jgi:hypothetical protein
LSTGTALPLLYRKEKTEGLLVGSNLLSHLQDKSEVEMYQVSAKRQDYRLHTVMRQNTTFEID